MSVEVCRYLNHPDINLRCPRSKVLKRMKKKLELNTFEGLQLEEVLCKNLSNSQKLNSCPKFKKLAAAEEL